MFVSSSVVPKVAETAYRRSVLVIGRKPPKYETKLCRMTCSALNVTQPNSYKSNYSRSGSNSSEETVVDKGVAFQGMRRYLVRL